MSKKDAEIYLRAAEFVFKDRIGFVASCWALDVAASDGDMDDVLSFFAPAHIEPFSKQRKIFNKTFAPRRCALSERWGDEWPDPVKCRVLALCFAAAMAATGDL